MKALLLPFLEGLLWLLRLLPKKPQPSQVRDTQPVEKPENRKKIDTNPNVLTNHIDRNKRIIKAYERLNAQSSYRPAQGWQNTVPRHTRDADLVAYLKRLGKI